MKGEYASLGMTDESVGGMQNARTFGIAFSLSSILTIHHIYFTGLNRRKSLESTINGWVDTTIL